MTGRWLLVALAAIACGGGNDRAAAPPATPEPPATPMTKEEPTVTDAAPACLLRIEADHGRSVLQEQRSTGPHAPDFFERYPSATIDPAAQQPVKVTEGFQIDGKPILWFTADKKAPVVDARAFGPLTAVDATRTTGAPIVIGQATAAARAALPPRDLVRFLIAAGVVQIYAHVGGWVCLQSETTDGGTWRGRFAGEHEYYTNEQNIDPLRFGIAIGADGTITFTPG